MKQRVRTILLILAIAIVVGGVVWGFIAGRGEQAAEAIQDSPLKAPSRISIQDGHTVLSFDSAAQQANGIRVSMVAATRQHAQVQATGVVVQLQPLLDLKASYNTVQTDLIRAQANARSSTAEYERLRLLNENEKNVADKAVEAARAAAENDAALVQSAQRTIAIVKEGAVLHWGPVIAGWIEGNSTQLDALLMQRMFLLQVTSASGGSSGEPREAIVEESDGSHTPAEFISVLPQLDPRLQAPSLLYRIAPHAGLVPGVNVSVLLPSGREQTGVVVPSSAVVWTQGSAWCYVESVDGKFMRVPVGTGSPRPGGWFVAQGIQPGARVVIAGAQTLLSEEFRSEIQQDQD